MAVVTPLNNPGGPEGDTVTVAEKLLNTEYSRRRWRPSGEYLHDAMGGGEGGWGRGLLMQGAVEQILASRAALRAKNPGLLHRGGQRKTHFSRAALYERLNPYLARPHGLRSAQKTLGCCAGASAKPISAGLRSMIA